VAEGRVVADGAGWHPPVILTTAPTGQGVDELVEVLHQHRADLQDRGLGADRRHARAASEITDLALGLLRSRVGSRAEGVAAGRITPHEAARQLVLDTARELAEAEGRFGADDRTDDPKAAPASRRRDASA
jgi:putative protein kinase ArgK-like GTPase of G3E family